MTLSPGSNVTITPSGNTLTIAATGAQGPVGATGPAGPTGPTGPQNGPNVIGGFSENFVTPGVDFATIGGGGWLGNANRVTKMGGTVGGGANNQAGVGTPGLGAYATVAGGFVNTASGEV